MTVEGLDYDALVTNEATRDVFVSNVKTTAAEQAGPGIRPEHVSVELRAGSVAVKTTITPPSDASASTSAADVQATLAGAVSSGVLEQAIVSTVASVPGIEEVSSGPIGLSSVAVPEVETQVIVVTHTTTETATGTETAPPLPCMEPPSLSSTGGVLFSANDSDCAGLSHGQACVPLCLQGYVWMGSTLECDDGEFTITGGCVLEGANGVQARVAAITQDVITRFQSIAGEPSAADMAWAELNTARLIGAMSIALSIPQRLIRINVLMPSASHRRLSANQSEVGLFSLKVVIILDQGGLPASIASNLSDTERVTAWLDSLTGGSWLDVLRERLLAEGEALPSGLGEARAQMASPAAIGVYAFVDEVQWLVSDFQDCPMACGAAVEVRSVRCSSGSLDACEEVAGPAPPVSRACQNYESCPATFMCPRGPDSDGNCNGQASGIIVSIVVGSSCLLLCFYRICKAYSHDADAGSVKVENVGSGEVDPESGNAEMRNDMPVLLHATSSGVSPKQSSNWASSSPKNAAAAFTSSNPSPRVAVAVDMHDSVTPRITSL